MSLTNEELADILKQTTLKINRELDGNEINFALLMLKSDGAVALGSNSKKLSTLEQLKVLVDLAIDADANRISGEIHEH